MTSVRFGTRVLDPRRVMGWLGKDSGQDWVVPKAAVRYLVTRNVAASLLLTAYDRDGQVLGERLFPNAPDGEDVMKRLFGESLVEEWLEIPDGSPSATRFLESKAEVL